jgi:serine/threonine-protein kinase
MTPRPPERDRLAVALALQRGWIDEAAVRAAADACARDGGDSLIDRLTLLAELSPSQAHELDSIAAELPTPLDAGPAFAAPPEPRAAAAARFDVRREHARGGLGIVSVALDAELRREVALKQIRPEVARDPGHRARFLLEAEITGQLEHPAIVPVYSLGRDEAGCPYYAMRLVRGETLHQAIARLHAPRDPDAPPPPTLRQLVRHLVTACEAVEYAHSRGVIHRDIKPSNILLGPYGETLLVDWGMAKVVGHAAVGPAGGADPTPVDPGLVADPTRCGSLIGTPGFMSPEQAAADHDRVGPAADVYGLGATLYTLIAGRTPFGDGAAEEIRSRVLAGDFPRPGAVRPRVPPALEAVALRAMALDPAGRYPSARALADDLTRWLDDEPVLARREPFPAAAGRWLARHRTLVAGLAAAAAAGLVALVALVAAQAAWYARLSERTAAHQAATRRAHDRFDVALAAITGFLREATRIDPHDDPLPTGLRRRLVESARDAYDGLLDRLEDDPEPAARLALARTSRELARATAMLQSHEAARPLLRRAAPALIAHADARPGDPEARVEAVEALVELARIEVSLGDFQAADAAITDARRRADGDDPESLRLTVEAVAQAAKIELYRGALDDAARLLRGAVADARRLAAAEPGARPRLAVHLVALADVELLRDRHADALPLDEEALAIWRDLAAARDDLETRRELALCLHRLGIAEAARDRPEAAIARWTEAVALRRSIVAFDPTLIADSGRLSRSLLRLSAAERRRGAIEHADALLDEARRLVEPLVEGDPDAADFRVLHAVTLQARADAAIAAGDPARAEALLDRAVDFARESLDRLPEVAQVRSTLAAILVRRATCHLALGRPGSAAADAREAVRLAFGHDDQPDMARNRRRAEQVLEQAGLLDLRAVSAATPE